RAPILGRAARPEVSRGDVIEHHVDPLERELFEAELCLERRVERLLDLGLLEVRLGERRERGVDRGERVAVDRPERDSRRARRSEGLTAFNVALAAAQADR